MVYKAPDLGYHTTLLTIPTVTKKKEIIFHKKNKKTIEPKHIHVQ